MVVVVVAVVVDGLQSDIKRCRGNARGKHLAPSESETSSVFKFGKVSRKSAGIKSSLLNLKSMVSILE